MSKDSREKGDKHPGNKKSAEINSAGESTVDLRAGTDGEAKTEGPVRLGDMPKLEVPSQLSGIPTAGLPSEGAVLPPPLPDATAVNSSLPSKTKADRTASNSASSKPPTPPPLTSKEVSAQTDDIQSSFDDLAKAVNAVKDSQIAKSSGPPPLNDLSLKTQPQVPQTKSDMTKSGLPKSGSPGSKFGKPAHFLSKSVISKPGNKIDQEISASEASATPVVAGSAVAGSKPQSDLPSSKIKPSLEKPALPLKPLPPIPPAASSLPAASSKITSPSNLPAGGAQASQAKTGSQAKDLTAAAQKHSSDSASAPISKPPQLSGSGGAPGLATATIVDTEHDAESKKRREAKRRPAAPSRERIAANDDVPSIGGLIYALNQKPSNRPFAYAAGASIAWSLLTLGYGWFAVMPTLPESSSLLVLLGHPSFLTFLATWAGPIALFWFLSALAWRSDELHLRSTAMTEVAVRLAEPDRMAEQSVASLGQTVRRQVSFMNDAVSRALGRAGELEALVHNEVSSLEQSYEDNERRIRGLIGELSGERSALLNTGQRFEQTLKSLGTEVPQLIEKLSHQQLTLANIIEGASTNLTSLETALGERTGALDDTLNNRTLQLSTVLEEYTSALGGALDGRSSQMQTMLSDYTSALGVALEGRTQQMHGVLEDQRANIDTALDKHHKVIDTKSTEIRGTLEDQRSRLDADLTRQQGVLEDSIGGRTKMLQVVFEEYTRALDTTLANRANALDTQLVERTKALDDAFSDRLRLFDETILRSTMAIDDAVGSNAKSLTSAMEKHADMVRHSLSKESERLDHTLMTGISAVQKTSENISNQSIKAIEGLAGQADMLSNVSENLLGQINTVTNRFENQGHTILRSANALESANLKINAALEERNRDLNTTLDRMSGKAEELGQVVDGYSNTLEGSLSTAQERARMITQELSRDAEQHSRSTLEDLHRLKQEAGLEADKALNDLRTEFTSAYQDATKQLGTLSTEFSQTSGEVRQQAAEAAALLEEEQMRLKQQIDILPAASQETSDAMRKALSDQLRALDQLTGLANRTSQNNEMHAPRDPVPLTAQPTTHRAPQPVASPPQRDLGPNAGSDRSRSRNLTNLTSTLARELNSRSRPDSKDDAETPSSRWSLGDLLARASENEQGGNRGRPALQTENPESTRPQRGHVTANALDARESPENRKTETTQRTGEPNLDINALANALDGATASVIWSRYRNGQRGFMVRSIYAPSSRDLFDDVVERYERDTTFRSNVAQFLGEFEQGLRELDQKDPSRQSSDAQIVTDTGRVYLVLAHASQRLA